MRRTPCPGTDARDRGASWLFVLAAVTGLTISLPCPVVAQATDAATPWASAWWPASRPQLPPQRVALTAAQRDALRWGARIGGFVGLATGVVLFARRDCAEEECLLTPVAAALSVGFGTALGTIGGMGIGLVVGSVAEGSRESGLRLGLAVSVGGGATSALPQR